jgi:hypothetical protein
MTDFLDVLARAAQRSNDSETELPMTPLQASGQAAVLQDRLELLNRPHTFKAGDLVQWKAGLTNRKLPILGQPAIVVEVLAAPVKDTSDKTGSTYYGETLDVRLGVLDPDGDFMVFHLPSVRFEPFNDTGLN